MQAELWQQWNSDILRPNGKHWPLCSAASDSTFTSSAGNFPCSLTIGLWSTCLITCTQQHQPASSAGFFTSNNISLWLNNAQEKIIQQTTHHDTQLPTLTHRELKKLPRNMSISQQLWVRPSQWSSRTSNLLGTLTANSSPSSKPSTLETG